MHASSLPESKDSKHSAALRSSLPAPKIVKRPSLNKDVGQLSLTNPDMVNRLARQFSLIAKAAPAYSTDPSVTQTHSASVNVKHIEARTETKAKHLAVDEDVDAPRMSDHLALALDGHPLETQGSTVSLALTQRISEDYDAFAHTGDEQDMSLHVAELGESPVRRVMLLDHVSEESTTDDMPEHVAEPRFSEDDNVLDNLMSHLIQKPIRVSATPPRRSASPVAAQPHPTNVLSKARASIVEESERIEAASMAALVDPAVITPRNSREKISVPDVLIRSVTPDRKRASTSSVASLDADQRRLEDLHRKLKQFFAVRLCLDPQLK